MFGLPTCKEVFEKRYEVEDYSAMKKLKYKIHIAMCKNCQNLLGTMKLMEDSMTESMKDKSKTANQDIINQIKKDIKTEISNPDSTTESESE